MGEDKARLPHADPGSGDWLGHSLTQLAPIVDELWVVGRTGPDGYTRPDGRIEPNGRIEPDGRSEQDESICFDKGTRLSWLADEEPDSGPVGGLVTAARVAGSRGMIVVACDVPGLTTTVLRKLQQVLSGEAGEAQFPAEASDSEDAHSPGAHDADYALPDTSNTPCGAAFVDDRGRIQGPAVALLPTAYQRLRDAFSRGDRKLQSVLESCDVAMLEASSEEQKVLRNLNSPSDREEFERKRDLQA